MIIYMDGFYMSLQTNKKIKKMIRAIEIIVG